MCFSEKWWIIFCSKTFLLSSINLLNLPIFNRIDSAKIPFCLHCNGCFEFLSCFLVLLILTRFYLIILSFHFISFLLEFRQLLWRTNALVVKKLFSIYHFKSDWKSYFEPRQKLFRNLPNSCLLRKWFLTYHAIKSTLSVCIIMTRSVL